MHRIRNHVWVLLTLGLPAATCADGLIHRLPEDGAWARFKVEGEALGSDGAITVTVEGTQTIRSVGRTTAAGQESRWIEVETSVEFRRSRGEVGKSHEITKLLIPEKRLAAGENAREHVLKAFKGEAGGKLRELDLEGSDAREIEALDEIFHAPLKDVSKLPALSIQTSGRTWMCEGVRGRTSSGGLTFRTEARLHEEAPFGVVTYMYEKERGRGTRRMRWSLVEAGKDAQSAAPEAR